jgi:hypothetical protein
MPQTPPDYKAIEIIAAAKAGGPIPEEPLEAALYHAVRGDTSVSTAVNEAFALYQDNEFCHIMNALVLADAPAHSVAASSGVSETIYATYKALFFRPDVFPHNFAKARYVAQLDLPEPQKKLYEIARDQGYKPLLDKTQFGTKKRIDANEVRQEALEDMWVRFTSHRGKPITSEEVTAALQWGKAALAVAEKICEEQKDLRRSKEGEEELRIALNVVKTRTTPEDLGIKREDIISD